MIDTSKLEAAVAAVEPGADSVVAFINALREQLKAELAGDPAAQAIIDAAADKVVAAQAKLGAAMEAEPTPTP